MIADTAGGREDWLGEGCCELLCVVCIWTGIIVGVYGRRPGPSNQAQCFGVEVSRGRKKKVAQFAPAAAWRAGGK